MAQGEESKIRVERESFEFLNLAGKPTGTVSHHDAPVQESIEVFFLQAGLDPNDETLVGSWKLPST